MSFLKHFIPFAFIILTALHPGIAGAQYAEVNFDVAHINNCVYEVIVPKPADDPITYEKPLPMDLLPFQVRNDKYYPVGTAFALNETEFVTASHVMSMGVKSQFTDVLIRDVKGNVFSVDQITKFSSRRDFVVFTVKGRQSREFLQPNLTPEVSEKVYAAGNALGQGLVIRDGLYTSATPEDINGEWNWIRFSAAASPGNSGGPLLDKNGKVVGIVLSKSQNENLNFALPIAEVTKDYGNNAEVYQKMTHALEIFDTVKTGTLDTQIKLPMSYRDFNQAYTAKFNEFNSQLRKDLLAENKASIFPNGSGSIKALYAQPGLLFPQLITKREDGTWEAGQPQNISKADLDNNGRIGYGTLNITLFSKIDRPENVSTKDLCSDSKLFMDLMLKAMSLTRTIGPEKIRILSLGKADNEYVHTDAFGRKWLVKTWPMEYSDQEIACFILPLPDGCAVMTKLGQTGVTLDDHIEDLKVLADFVNISYAGTFKQWTEYLALRDFIPRSLSGIEIKPGTDSFLYKSKRFMAGCDPGVMKMSDKSYFILGFGFLKDGDSVVWDVKRLMLTEGKLEKNGFGLSRYMKPVDDNERYSDTWSKLAEGRKPFDKKIAIKDEATGISTVYRDPADKPGSDHAVLYDVFHLKRGVIEQGEMEAGLDRFLKSIAVYEK